MKLTIIKKNPHPDDHARQSTDTPGFKPFTMKLEMTWKKNNKTQQNENKSCGYPGLKSKHII